ncbi:flagellar hook-associated protein FlgK [Cryobacterium levicorallinum]|uniref:Flagellar hook-associated protein 1 n=1 Tax=Cryobacterium levicorallinum TaxID=995038 RepID=A0A1I3BSY1_9MICO|nr:flagellar hook-associated protein FlgK [Cryobacterium levicorallinum]TFB81324.1 flagellar hook-associated protein FlgK [Cryobacterium levicorallinum]GEP28340.1 flagellar hook-associated protein 1 [Cryobacterium levicorallinum]SFH65186.1 flagellar hook-associated protein 1 FlgK [Cryobacterium levicorallinum]
MSTFSGLNTAYSGLVAARKGLDLVGQNISNANTVGYTRQRVTTSAVGSLAETGQLTGGLRVGEGVSVDGIARLGNAQLDAHVRNSAAAAGYTAVRANSLSSIETSLNEPGENGISAKLDEFWAGWQELSNGSDSATPAALLLSTAGELTTMIAQGYQAVSTEYSSVRGDLGSMVSELNTAASQVAALNVQIRTTLATGGSANELLDQRELLTTTISALTGASVVAQSDGTVNVLIGGNALVSGGTASALTVSGASTLDDAMGGSAVTLAWADSARTSAVTIDGGEIAGALTLLATEGDLVTAAQGYNAFAENLAKGVNDIYKTNDDKTNFFTFESGNAARSLAVIPQTGSAVHSGNSANGAYDDSIADAIAQLGAGKAVDVDGNPVVSPNTTWSDFVSTIAVATQSELQQANLASTTATYASSQQLANSSVDLDEENVNLLMFQTAYQGAARVLTAVDEMLDTLINRTGLVGR